MPEKARIFLRSKLARRSGAHQGAQLSAHLPQGLSHALSCLHRMKIYKNVIRAHRFPASHQKGEEFRGIALGRHALLFLRSFSNGDNAGCIKYQTSHLKDEKATLPHVRKNCQILSEKLLRANLWVIRFFWVGRVPCSTRGSLTSRSSKSMMQLLAVRFEILTSPCTMSLCSLDFASGGYAGTRQNANNISNRRIASCWVGGGSGSSASPRDHERKARSKHANFHLR